jgi:hypothetical protein
MADFEALTHGRYTIKSGPLKDRWGANAFRGKALIAKATGKSREEAIEAVKEELTRIDSIALSERDEEGAPSAKEYARAILAIEPISESYRAMLRAHLNAPDHLISATKLAEAANYAGYEAANLHYGTLGKMIADEIGFLPPKRANGDPIWTCAIARDPNLDTEFPETSLVQAALRNIDQAHFEWQMRPQVVEALRSLDY